MIMCNPSPFHCAHHPRRGRGLVTAEAQRYHLDNEPVFPDVDRQKHGCEGAGAIMRVGFWERWHRGDDLETSQIGGDEAPPGDIMRRFSIRTLMSAIVVSAIGLAALRNASDLWAGIMLLVALAAVGVAVLGAIILRGRDR
jgi:hypothetical protein